MKSKILLKLEQLHNDRRTKPFDSIEKSDKELFVITVDTYETDKEVRKKLRLDTHLANVKVILVDPKTRAANEVMWFEEVSKQIG